MSILPMCVCMFSHYPSFLLQVVCSLCQVGLPVVEAPESSPSPSVAPSTDKNSNTLVLHSPWCPFTHFC
jgi:hypothetical protein